MGEFEAQGPEFNINDWGGQPNHLRFYCPSCSQKVEFHLYDKFEDETYDCPMCQGIMLREDNNED